MFILQLKTHNLNCMFTASANDFTGLRNDFVMIKYPRKGRTLPHDRVFTMDPAYLVRLSAIYIIQPLTFYSK